MTQPLPIRRKPQEGAAGQAEGLTVQQRLRARREHLAKGSTRDFEVPGYGGELVARYRRLTFEELQQAFKGVGKDSDVVSVNAQFLVDACVELLTREPDGSLKPLVEGHKTTYTVNLDSGQSLGTIMGVEHLPTIRDQLVAEFGDNELAVNEHSGEVHRWMTTVNSEDTESALGEAVAR